GGGRGGCGARGPRWGGGRNAAGEPRARPRRAAPAAARASGRDGRQDAPWGLEVPPCACRLRARASGLRARRADPGRGRDAVARPLLLFRRLASPPMEGALETTRRGGEGGDG